MPENMESSNYATGSSCTYRFIPSTSNNASEEREHQIILRQQPQIAKMSVVNERDRRPIEPAPILQLKWPNCSSSEIKEYLQSPFYFMVINLVLTDSPDEFLVPSQDYLSGSTVSSLHRLRDTDNTDGGFFVFGDLAVKKEGKFKLHFSLYEITETFVHNRMTLLSEEFTVYVPRKYPGPLEATFLSRMFSDQGIKMRLRKEHRLPSASARKRKLERTSSQPDQRREQQVRVNQRVSVSTVSDQGHSDNDTSSATSVPEDRRYSSNTTAKQPGHLNTSTTGYNRIPTFQQSNVSMSDSSRPLYDKSPWMQHIVSTPITSQPTVAWRSSHQFDSINHSSNDNSPGSGKPHSVFPLPASQAPSQSTFMSNTAYHSNTVHPSDKPHSAGPYSGMRPTDSIRDYTQAVASHGNPSFTLGQLRESRAPLPMPQASRSMPSPPQSATIINRQHYLHMSHHATPVETPLTSQPLSYDRQHKSNNAEHMTPPSRHDDILPLKDNEHHWGEQLPPLRSIMNGSSPRWQGDRTLPVPLVRTYPHYFHTSHQDDSRTSVTLPAPPPHTAVDHHPWDQSQPHRNWRPDIQQLTSQPASASCIPHLLNPVDSTGFA